MNKGEKVTPIRPTQKEAEQDDREQRAPKESGRRKAEQGVSNRSVQEETARQAKVMPFRDEQKAGKPNKTGSGDR